MVVRCERLRIENQCIKRDVIYLVCFDFDKSSICQNSLKLQKSALGWC